MQINLKADKLVGMAVLKLLDSLVLMATRNDAEADPGFTVDVSFEDKPVKAARTSRAEARSMARTQYRAILPDGDATTVNDTIKKNLAGVGEHTITGLIYMDMVQARTENKWLTEPEIRKARDLPGGTSQRSVGQLCRIGIVEKRDIPETQV